MENNYKRKYQKYKSKYLSLKNSENFKLLEKDVKSDSFSFSRESGIDTTKYGVERVPKYIDDDYRPVVREYPFYLDDDINVTIRKNELSRPTTFEEENEYINIGKKGLARGNIKEDVDDDEFTKLSFEPQKDKILLIDNIDSFDNFTEKYGKLGSNDIDNDKEYLYIKWDKVAEDYNGFYLNPGLNKERYNIAFYKGKTYPSWWEYEYDVNGAIIFE